MPATPTSWLDHVELRSTSRLSVVWPGLHPAWMDAAIALLFGALAAMAVTLIDFRVRLPGHAILKATLPIALGLALAPRRFSGLVIGLGSLGTLTVLRRFGFGSGIGAIASLLALGPFLDLLLWNAKQGWSLYLRFALAGLFANCAAFAIRGGGKAAGFDSLSMRPLHDWLTVAPWTYATFGLVSGLICVLILFRYRGPSDPPAGGRQS